MHTIDTSSFEALHTAVYGLERGAIPDPVVHQARRCLLDLIGVLVAGRTTPMSQIIHNHAHRHFASQYRAIPLLGDGRSSNALGVALAGGITIDSIDAHDGMRLTKGHAGCGVLPALIAMLEDSGKDYSDADLLLGLILGYEGAIRAGIALHANACDYHTSGAWVALGVASIGARIYRLTETQLFEALGIAEYHGPRSPMMRVIDYPTMVKDGSGWGAMAGVSAVFLAQDGFTGAPAMTVTDPKLTPIWTDLGSVWHITDQYMKPWPVCRWAQPAMTAVMALMQDNSINSQDIEKITVYSFHEAVRLATRIPQNTEQAQYSLPWPVAAAAVTGRLQREEITEPFDDSRIIALAENMELVEDSAYNAKFPKQRWARVAIALKSGAVVTSPDTEASWDPETPPSDAELHDKFHQLSDAVIGEARAKALFDIVWGLEFGGHNAKPLVALLSQNFLEGGNQ